MKVGHLMKTVYTVGATVLSLAVGGQAFGQGLHGITIAKGCVSPLCVGETTKCDIKLGYNDEYGDTIEILAAWDVQDLGGDDVRVPGMGDLPIVAVGGNTTCTVDGTLPCRIGPGDSMLSGLPGDSEPGFVRFRQNTYVIEPDDPDTLVDQATVQWEDLCDAPGTSGCGSGVVNPAPAPASTIVTRCNDGDACTIDECVLGECTFTPIVCDDGNPCTTDECMLGICVHTTINCGDGDPCTEDSCDPVTGECVNTPINCDDVDLCTTDECVDGVCVNTPTDCDDGDACTEDTCDPDTGECMHAPTFTCDDNDACTEDACDPVTGECVFTPIVCDDGDLCTMDECIDGVCVFTDVVCDDGDYCTEDTCDPMTGECVFTPIDPPPPGCGEAGDGCTPGFWKQSQHAMAWTGYSPDDMFEAVFGVDAILLDGKTLLEALRMGGGKELALGRHAVAALLNAASDEVDYLYTEAEVISMVQDAYATGHFNATKDMFEMENERGCTVDMSRRTKGQGGVLRNGR